jgi:hypothetical protein
MQYVKHILEETGNAEGQGLYEVVRYPEPGPLKVSPPLSLYLSSDCL